MTYAMTQRRDHADADAGGDTYDRIADAIA